jgi:hypothetical protein
LKPGKSELLNRTTGAREGYAEKRGLGRSHLYENPVKNCVRTRVKARSSALNSLTQPVVPSGPSTGREKDCKARPFPDPANFSEKEKPEQI